jgi:hypothetical protein
LWVVVSTILVTSRGYIGGISPAERRHQVSSDQAHPDEKAKAKQEAFLQKDYELKIGYLTDQFARMWNRFNYFVAIEAALVGGKFLIPNGVLSRALAIAGVLISALWYVMGAEDRYLVRLYRYQVEKAAKAVVKTIWTDEKTQNAYRYVGQVDDPMKHELREYELREKDEEGKDSQGRQKSFWKRLVELEWLSGWRVESISTTRLAALLPLLVLVLWLIILVYTLVE